MKKIIPLISGLFIVSAPLTNLIHFVNQKFYSINLTSYSAQEPEILQPTSMLNLQKTLNGQTAKSFDIKDSQWDTTAEQTTNNKYKTFLDGHSTSSLAIFNQDSDDEIIQETFSDTYTNNTPNKQTYQTQSYSKTITNTSTFSIKLAEAVNVEANVNFIFVNTKIVANLSSDQTWTNTTTVAETLTAPSQSIIVDPFSIGKVDYVIREGTYNSVGVLRTFIPIDSKFMSSNWWSRDNRLSSTAYKIPDLIHIWKKGGYADLLKMTSKHFSIISVDNLENPKIACVNVPISWYSKGGKLDVSFTQEPLSL